MNEREALLAAIHDSPDEDTVRLAYADWLDEHGDAAQAEFIRVQIALARTPVCDPQRGRLYRLEKELLAANRVAWVGERVATAPLESWVFQRGFPERLNLEGELIGDHGVKRLTSSPHLVGVSSINLESNEIGDRGAELLGSSPNLPHLRELSLYGNEISDDGVIELFFADELPRMTHLDFRFNRMTDLGVLFLVVPTVKSRLKRIDLFGNELSSRCIQSLRVKFPSIEITY